MGAVAPPVSSGAASGGGSGLAGMGMLAGANFLSNYLMAKRQEQENRRDRVMQALAQQQSLLGQQGQMQNNVMQSMTNSYRSALS